MEEKKDYNAQINELIKQADEQFVKFIKDGKYKDVLLSMSNLNQYSFRNQILIMIQKPDAKCVNGMSAWNYFKRSIKKGEKGLKIIAPTKYYSEEEQQHENGEIETVKTERLGYKIAYVFDVSQTDGEHEIRLFESTEELVREEFESLREVLELSVKDYKFVYTSDLQNGVDGTCNHKDKVIKVRDGMTTEKTLTTLIHEIAHAIAEERTQDSFKGLTKKEVTQIKEIEAESVALVVSNRLGLHTQDFNLAYIAGWADGDIEKFRYNLDTIRGISHQLLSAIEPKIDFLRREKEKVNQVNKEQVVTETNKPVRAKKTKSEEME